MAESKRRKAEAQDVRRRIAGRGSNTPSPLLRLRKRHPPPRRLAVRKVLALASVLLVVTCAASAFDLQGHRGARGLAPENTLAGFAVALGLGVTTLELDVGVSADGVVVVSHDAVLNPSLARGPDGEYVPTRERRIRDLSLAELRRYDVGRIKPGSRYAGRFPEQRTVDGAGIPTLAEVFELTAKAGNDSVRFNIETKIRPTAPDATVSPEVFVEALLAAIRSAGLARRVTIQSFDWQTLRLVQAREPAIPTVCLTVEARWLDNVQRGEPGASPWTAGVDFDDGGGIADMARRAGCAVWSPYHENLTPAELAQARAAGLRVVPWTVNEPERMTELIDLGVDGLITDFPDRLRKVMAARAMALPAPTPVKP